MPGDLRSVESPNSALEPAARTQAAIRRTADPCPSGGTRADRITDTNEACAPARMGSSDASILCESPLIDVRRQRRALRLLAHASGTSKSHTRSIALT